MIRLECTADGSHKFYELHMHEADGEVTVSGVYGAIGRAGKEIMIYEGESREEAERAVEKKKQEKLKKGYVVVGA